MVGIPVGRVLIGSILLAFLGLGSYVLQISEPHPTSMLLTPSTTRGITGETIVVEVVVESEVPVNAFAGTVTFDPAVLAVASIDYNTSIADLWAEKPWYENGAGTVSFAGGSTKSGGFTGAGTLLTITFTGHTPGESPLVVENAQILQHDGLGSDTTVKTPIDTIFTIEADVAPTIPTSPETSVVVSDTLPPSTDLNGDGRQSIADVSILMQYLFTGDLRGDLNGDGQVSLADLSLILTAK